MRRITPDDRRRALDSAMANLPADGSTPSAADLARRTAVILRDRGVDPGCPKVLAGAMRSRPDFQAAQRAKRARADEGRAQLAAASTPAWRIERLITSSLAAFASSADVAPDPGVPLLVALQPPLGADVDAAARSRAAAAAPLAVQTSAWRIGRLSTRSLAAFASSADVAPGPGVLLLVALQPPLGADVDATARSRAAAAAPLAVQPAGGGSVGAQCSSSVSEPGGANGNDEQPACAAGDVPGHGDGELTAAAAVAPQGGGTVINWVSDDADVSLSAAMRLGHATAEADADGAAAVTLAGSASPTAKRAPGVPLLLALRPPRRRRGARSRRGFRTTGHAAGRRGQR